MDKDLLELRCAELEERIRLLTIENDHLAERAEETLLLGLLAEKVHASADADELVTVALEQIAVLKGLPYVGCYAAVDGRAWLVHEYAFAPVAHPAVRSISVAPDLLAVATERECVLTGPECGRLALAARVGSDFRPRWLSLQPMRNRQGGRLFLVFAADKSRLSHENLQFLLPRVSEMIAARLENLELLEQLTRMNESLDQKVHERTADLRASEKRLRTLFEESLDCCLVVDGALTIKVVNRQACLCLGYERAELVEKGLAEVGAGEWPESASDRDAARSGPEIRSWEGQLRRKDGTTLPAELRVSEIELDGQPMHLVQARDVSERDRLLAQLNQSQKMEAVGRLAGGIAHDFNNILTAIIGQLDLLAMDIPAESALASDLGLIRHSSERAAGLTRQLLAFSRKQVLDMGPQNLTRRVAASARMLERVVDEAIELKWDLDENAGWLYGDEIQIEQMLMNLVLNARDAIEGRGEITITTSRADCEADDIVPHPQAPHPNGEFLSLTVSDTGAGIPEEIRAKIFDPFFTTKEVGKGTGLGLALVYSLAQQHHGRVDVQSVPGSGATFEIVFPAIAAPESSADDTPITAIPRGRETILLVEDDEAIRAVVSHMIRDLGYELLQAKDGLDALAVAEAHRARIDLVLSDVVMPRMGGPEMVAELVRARGALAIIYMSGYTDDLLGRDELGRHGARFLQKPVRLAVLAHELRGALDESGAG